MARFQTSIIMFFAHLILLLGLPTALVGAIPVTPAPKELELAASKRAASSYWVGTIKRQGTVPFGNSSDYQVFRNVKDFGAKGDGSTDDTAAINSAISSGGRCGKGCDSSTTTPALVYFPPGTYVVSKPIVQYYYTQIVGDAVDLPVIKAAAAFSGMAVIDADPYEDNGDNWYTNQNNFFRAIRNLVIDLTAMPQSSGAGIHWQVGQATSLQNIRFEMIKGGGSANKQQGIFMDNGSGGFMSDLTFNGGNYGMFLGNQQFTTRNLTFNGCQTAIYMNWNWAWTFKSVNINNCNVGLNMSTSPSNQTVGSVMMLDSKLTNTPTGIVTAWTKNSIPVGGGTLVLDNVDFSGSTVAVAGVDGNTILAGGSVVDSWVQGNTYTPSSSASAKRAYRSEENDDNTEVVTIVETVVKTVTACPATNSAATLATNVATSANTQVTTPVLPTGTDSGDRSVASQAAVSSAILSGLPGMDNSWLSFIGSSGQTYEVTVPTTQTPAATEETTATVPAAGESTAAVVAGSSEAATVAETSQAVPVVETSSAVTVAQSTVSSGTSSAVVSHGTASSTSSSSSNGSGTCKGSANQAVESARTQSTMKASSMPSDLLTGGAVFEKSKPLYESLPASSFVSVKSAGAKGDGTTDDTAALQKVLDSATTDQVVYFDHGAYVITSTLKVPKDIKITGEVWPMIMAHGSKFQDEKNPIPAVQVGQKGESGSVELSDLIITTKGAAPGAILMEWNVAASSQGSAGMWDVHIRIGGAAGTGLQSNTCPKTPSQQTTPRTECIAAFLLLHITEKASAYIENSWMWTADHELDLADHNQINVYTGRGVLVESQGPVWLWGTASEHHQLYNYQVSNAANVFMGLIQTETPYYQSNPTALVPFTPQDSWNDPDFSTCTTASCKKSWGLRVMNTSDLFIYGAGLYSFFENYAQTCLNTEDCQENMVEVDCSDVHIYGLSTKAAVNMVTSAAGKSMVPEKPNMSNFCSTIALFEQSL
ncbi:glucan endo-1-3-beta-glucosidase [Penicillium cataractarum]|uniref:Glucan endo-1-3-beta-glucosidase n=1 Tax=Penicillium cataractarum TaxID=2100454 RepID=A0A9W9RFQ7_9EURO|nr:glucan endo-1-3-beta-glucosidase [Penicillium cataractarum]KAJ5359418.1 glucan endo-1-3-beta-glucosidase [Penicillium cataractarum]